MPNDDQANPLDQRWLVLDNLLKELFKTHEIPQEVVQNLQHARALTNYYNDDPTAQERIKELPKIDSLLNNAEQKLMIMAEDEGTDFVEEWTQKLVDASQGKEVFKDHKIQSKFIPGMPANFDFVRFNFRDEIQVERFYEVCEYENVIIEFDDNDKSVFIFGEKDNISNALREMASFFQEQVNI
ncbi:MAG: DUF2096 family protein [Methanosphaera sp.]|uniref:DUF2096 family protein n=1 Tax=Methanosphaera sp. BMS TaxID=1789762 RepID=UPI000DC1E9B3|nr:DUF2096 family protein [Methanosphaera sp. BMS]AWX33554.1 hypothetical protein AW729_10840 [Methanosphaera sp. BMS]MBQ6443757.1 DUF2096 family protein [Methanosphaera sp.]